ncbi:putative Chemotaxis protein CheW [Hyella patelloides LEGE 07179]|uniref:Putative Chemotaxis protein CheW n=1 Tax=Hyella patelloides LEGE 07179 TaxID=945734 RepID=A0A563VUK2_9CYAN|nr:chemotaxis protein CheW [Hyella patelloides]VEP14951.1 putative Chemotaxis protein CheW [Hyella patelloides LEGE 07179]
MISTKNSAESQVKAQFLQLHLASGTIALLPTEKVSKITRQSAVQKNLELIPTQVLTISADRVVSMPHMASWVMGAYNYRGKIMWLVDLGYLMGLVPISRQARSLTDYTTVMVHISSDESSNQLVGLVVNRVNSIERCNLSSIITSSAEPNTEFDKFFQGYWEKCATEILPVLDLELIGQKIFDY